MDKKLMMLCLAFAAVCGNVQGQGFLKKLGDTVDKAAKTLNGNQKNAANSSSTKATTSKSKKASSLTARGDDGQMEPTGYKSNLYGGDMDNEPKEIAKFAEFKKTENTKIITVEDINDLKLGYPSDNRIIVSSRQDGTICIDDKGNTIKKLESSGLGLGKDVVIQVPRFNSGRLIYKTSEKVGDRWSDVATICDKNMKVIKKIQDVETFSSFKNGISVMYYMVMSKEKHQITPYIKCMYVDVNGNKVFPNLSQPYENNTHGHWLVKNDTRPLSDGLAAFSVPKDRELTWGFRDTNGKVVVPAKYIQVRDFSNGMAAVATNESGTTKWGFIDTSGKEVIPPKFSIEPSRFDNCGLALVFNKEEKGMFIDKTGKIVSKEYEGTHISPFYNGKAILTISEYDDEKGWTNGDVLLDKDFNTIAHIGRGDRLSGGSVKDCGMRYYIDIDSYTNGYYPSPVLYFENRIYLQLKKLGYGLLDERGNVIIAGLAGPFVDGLAPVISKAGKGYVNEKGEWVIKFEESKF